MNTNLKFFLIAAAALIFGVHLGSTIERTNAKNATTIPAIPVGVVSDESYYSSPSYSDYADKGEYDKDGSYSSGDYDSDDAGAYSDNYYTIQISQIRISTFALADATKTQEKINLWLMEGGNKYHNVQFDPIIIAGKEAIMVIHYTVDAPDPVPAPELPEADENDGATAPPKPTLL